MSVSACAQRVVVAVALALIVTAIPSHADGSTALFGLVDAAAERLATADAVAASKWITGGSIEDPVRERQVLDAVTAMAGENGADRGYVETAFRDQIDATVAVEYGLFSEWKLDPAGAPATAPNLSDSRAAIDGLNRTIVTEIVGQWDSLHSTGCPEDLTTALTAVAAARGLDGVHQRGLSFATRSYCR